MRADRQSALAKLSQRVARFNLAPDQVCHQRRPWRTFPHRATVAMQAGIRLDIDGAAAIVQQHRQEVLRVTRFLRDRTLHSRFWHWLDRFFYEELPTMARTRRPIIKTLESPRWRCWAGSSRRGAAAGLAAGPESVAGVAGSARWRGRGDLQVFFWIEPFGLIDLWDLEPGRVLVSFSQPEAVYHNFHAFCQRCSQSHAKRWPIRRAHHFAFHPSLWRSEHRKLTDFMEIYAAHGQRPRSCARRD